MNGSKEELIDMVELTSPMKRSSLTRPKKRNQIHSPPFVSPVRSVDKDVTSLFSVKKSSKISSFEDDTETISELSDDVLSEQSLKNFSKSEDVGTTSRSKSRQSSRKANKVKLSLEKIRRESSEVDANIKSVRSRLSLEEKRVGNKSEVSFFTSVVDKLEEKDEDTGEEGIEEHPGNNKEGIKYFLPENLCFNLDLTEKDSLFVPARALVPVNSKLVDEQPRVLEKEGFYVNSDLKVPKSNLNIIERRLLSVEDKKWFNCAGNLTVLPTPIIDRSIKPDVEIRLDDGVVYGSSQKHPDMEEVLVVQETMLELSLSSLKFSHHPLFSLEHVLQEKLHEAFQKYSSSVGNNTLQKLRNQLEAAKHAKRLKMGDSKEVTVKEIKKLRDDLFKEGKMQRDGLKFILEIWKGIKKLRQEQKFSNTTARLIIKKEKSNLAEEKETYQKFFADTLQDVLDDHRNTYKRKLKEYHKKVNAKKEAISHPKSDSDEGDNSELEKPTYDVDEKKIESQLWQKFEESFKPPGILNM